MARERVDAEAQVSMNLTGTQRNHLEIARRECPKRRIELCRCSSVGSYAPVMNMSVPLSATINPYRFIARNTFCSSGGKAEDPCSPSVAAGRPSGAPLPSIRPDERLGIHNRWSREPSHGRRE